MKRLVCALSCFGLVAISALTRAAAVTPLRVASRNSAGEPANQGAELPTSSETGRFVAFSSISDNLVRRDRNGTGISSGGIDEGASRRSSVLVALSDGRMETLLRHLFRVMGTR